MTEKPAAGGEGGCEAGGGVLTLKHCLLLKSVGGHFSHVPFLRQETESVLGEG